MNPRDTLKRLLVAPILYLLGRRRLSISNHSLSSREVTSIRQSSQSQPPSQNILDLASLLYSQYTNSAETFKPPRCSISTSPWDIYPNLQTGEHYVLLPLVAKIFSAINFVEIGTFQGCSAKALLNNTKVNITTFDIVPWDKISPTFLCDSDFSSGRIIQFIDDLSCSSTFSNYYEVFSVADVIFIDGPKNRRFEEKFISLLFDFYRKSPLGKTIVLVMDDVRTSTMVDIWSSIPYPKIILDEIGHWSGTGIVLLDTSCSK